MAWHHMCTKPLCEPMMTKVLAPLVSSSNDTARYHFEKVNPPITKKPMRYQLHSLSQYTSRVPNIMMTFFFHSSLVPWHQAIIWTHDDTIHMHHQSQLNQRNSIPDLSSLSELTHWGRVTHICVGKLTNIHSDNGLSPERRQAIIWTNVGILLIGHLGTNFSENLFIYENAIESVVCEMASILSRPQSVNAINLWRHSQYLYFIAAAH